MIKNITIILALIFTFLFNALPANAIYWYEYHNKSYIDLDSVTGTHDLKRAWLKLLNPGDWELEQNKKVWFQMLYVEVHCKSTTKQARILHGTYYDLQGKVILSVENDNSDFFFIVPQSLGDIYTSAICNAPTINN